MQTIKTITPNSIQQYLVVIVVCTILISPIGVTVAPAQDLVPTSSLTGGSSIFVFRKAVARPAAPPARQERSRNDKMATIVRVKRQYDTIAKTAPKRERETVVDPNKLPKGYRSLPAAQGSKLFAGVAEYYLARDDFDKSIEFFRDSIALDDKNTRAKGGLADALVRKGNDRLVNDRASEARAFFNEALKYDPSNAGAYFGLGEALSDEGKADEAIANFERALSNDKDLTEIFVPLGILYYQTGQIAKADEMLTRAVGSSADSAETQFFLGLVRKVQGRDNEALAAFESTVKTDPKYADAYYNIAEIRSRRGEFKPAIENYRKAVELRPTYFEAWLGLAEAYYDDRDDANAIEAYKTAARLKNDRWQVYAGVGEAYLRDRKYIDASTNFVTAAEFLGRDASASKDQIAEYFGKAGFSVGMQCEINMREFRRCDWPTAVSYLQRAADLTNSPYDYANLGWALYNSARTDINMRDTEAAKPKLEAAKAALQKALTGDPAVIDGVNQNLGSVLIDQGDFRGAIDVLKKVVDKRPTWIMSRYALGTAYFRVNEFENAAKAFRSALEIDRDHVPSLTNLGFTEIKRKKADEVKKIIERLKAVSPSDAQRLDREMKLARL